jgi:hypothetical protein
MITWPAWHTSPRRSGKSMPLFCYVHRRGGATPYLEVLPDMPSEDAARRAAQLIAERADAERAELWDGEELVLTLNPAPAD